MRTLSSVDAVLTLVIPGVYSSPVRIQKFSTDDMFETDGRPLAETRMGADGHLSAGYVIHPRKMKIKLEADSPSQQVFDDWAQAQDSGFDVIYAQGIVLLTSNGSQFNCTNGVLTLYQDMPAAKKTLQPMSYEITWESITKVEM